MSSPPEEDTPTLASIIPASILSSALSAAVSAAMAVAMAVDGKESLAALLEEWEEAQRGTTEQLVSILTKISELIEKETGEYHKADPDPFDDRHPGRADPNCMLGVLLKILFMNDDFTNALLDTYIMTSRELSLNTAACRLLQNIMPGLETGVVFQEKEGLVEKLFTWAREAERPLCVYATGLLARAMSNQEVAASYREENAQLVPIMIQRLRELQSEEAKSRSGPATAAPTQNLPQDSQDETSQTSNSSAEQQEKKPGDDGKTSSQLGSAMKNGGCSGSSSTRLLPDFVYQASLDLASKEAEDRQGGRGAGGRRRVVKENGRKAKQKLNYTSSSTSFRTEDKEEEVERNEASKQQPTNSSTSWSEMSSMVIGSDYHLLPLSPAMEQRLILQYLTPLGDYQELLAVFMQMDTRSLLMNYIDLWQTKTVQLTFDALLYLASLLLHKKFAAEFIAHGGVQKLLEIPRPSMAATGVSLCLYYLAYNQDAMERVCTLSGGVLSDMVSYALWLLESSHASGVCHATMFFSISFSFRAVLQLFDHQDGLRRLVNLVSTLEILNTDTEVSVMNDDQVFSSRQTAKHTCMALRRYFEAHLAVKAEQVKQSLHSSDGGTVVPQQPFYKAYTYTREQVIEMMEFLIECGPPQLHWEAVEVFYKLSCVPLMLQLISTACDWRTYYGRSDTVRYALDILAMLVVVPKVQLVLADTVDVLDETRSPVSTVGMSIILGVAEGEVFVNDAEIQKSALQVIINCVCAPDQSLNTLGAFAVAPLRPSLHPQQPPAPHNRVLAHMWQVVQNNNGIKVLLSLLSVKMPITDADLIRSLACKALVGLSRSTAIRQIISKLPLFTSSHIQQLMKEPVLQDKRSEHVRFCRYAAELTERVSGKPLLMGSDVSLARLQRANVVAQSRITFSEKELLMLIRNHLTAKGLHETANLLIKEANLPVASLCPHSTCITPPPPSSSILPRSCRLAGGIAARNAGHVGSSPVSSVVAPAAASSSTPSSSSRCLVSPHPSCPSSSTSTHPPHLVGRILFSRERPTAHCSSSGKKLRALKQKSDHGAFIQTPAMKKQLERHLPSPPTLDSIITEYLREQHARCPNPVTTCPPFSLFTPHRCPESKQRRQASPNFTARLGSRVLYPKYGGVDRGCLDRHLIFSRFRPMSVFHEGDGDESGFTCCAFSARERFLMLGTCSGHLKFYNVFSGEEVANYTCHTSAITHLEPSRDGKLLLTSASWSVPLSALWSMDGVFTMKNSFVDDHYVEFSKLSQDRVIGTKDQVAHIYDIQTGQKTLTLNDPALANNYKRNCATFNPTDDLVLNDGVLWDVRASRAIHKFDKFNMNISGVFHPNGLEVIVNTEIWDLRTFHLLHTAPALDQCRLVFNSNGTIMYGAMLQADDEDDAMDQQMKSPFGSSFRTFDATDYKPIATVDVKRNIFDLCTDTKDCYLAVIENQDTVSLDTVCRLYEVGRQKLAEEGDDDDQDDEDQDDDDSSDTDDFDADDDDDEDDMDTDPLIEELANDENQENGDGTNSPTDEEIADLLGSNSNDDEDNSDDDESEDSEHSDRSNNRSDSFDADSSFGYPEQSDEDSPLFQALRERRI
ncbi:DDB1- and CUL4-associated factor 1 [Larimichthys crocea]|uniref:DDB1- and CUL4-associated factor 1 n=1 Tax=Larimichthys crocea TaxID=215358 RepID=A0A6G0J5M4_LARCR|nr:DDB1- and CUL4-associated factor 1 [Larimichthys crocea]